MMQKTAWLSLLLLALVPEARAYRLAESGDAHVDFKAFFQMWAHASEDGSPDGDNWAAQLYARRMRLLFSGQVHPNIKFFYGTVHSNFGKDGRFNAAVTTGDAWVELDLGRALKVDVGLLMIPFVHNFRQGGSRIHTIDWHLPVRKFPVTSHFLGRDTGIGVRGLVLDDTIGYVVHVTQGTRTGDGTPRLTGRLMLNLFDAETSFHYAGTYLGEKRIVSFGLAVDTQPGGGLTPAGRATDYYALGGDVVVDYPIGQNAVVAQVNVAYYRHSFANAAGATCNLASAVTTCKAVDGLAVLSEAGYRIDKVEPLVGFDWFRPRNSSAFRQDYARVFLGLNYWFLGHKANLKAQYTMEKPRGVAFDDAVHSALLQAHVMFN